jgi:hypothetical protein
MGEFTEFPELPDFLKTLEFPIFPAGSPCVSVVCLPFS